jgi:hypothetical protein
MCCNVARPDLKATELIFKARRFFFPSATVDGERIETFTNTNGYRHVVFEP